MSCFPQFLTNSLFAFRALSRRPCFTAAAVVTLALGVTSVTLAFNLTYEVLLRALPYPDPVHLVRVQEDPGPENSLGLSSPKNLVDWIRHSPRGLEGISAYQSGAKVVSNGREPLRVLFLSASEGLLEVVGAHTYAGRLFTPDEYRSPNSTIPTVSGLVLVSYSFWKEHLESRPDILGQAIEVEGDSATVVGILAPDVSLSPFHWDRLEPQIIHPMDLPSLAQRYRRRGVKALQVVARIRPGVTRQDARRELNAIADTVAAETRDPEAQVHIELVPLLETLVADSRRVLQLLGGATALLFLIACTNAGSLLLLRTRRRSLEIGIRRALGAGRIGIGGLILAEATWIALLAGFLSFFLVLISYGPLARLARDYLPRLQTPSIDWSVPLFAATLTFLTLFFIGLLSVGLALRGQIRDCLTDNLGNAGSQLRASRLVVIGQLMLCVTLLVGAGLVYRTLSKLAGVEMGFVADNLILVRMTYSRDFFRDSSERTTRIDTFLEQLRELPAVRSVGYGNAPLESGRTAIGLYKEGSEQPLAVAYNPVGADYFATLGIPILRGQDFRGDETREPAPVLIVNESFAAEFFPGEEVVGKRLRDTTGKWFTIVGECADVRFQGLLERPHPAVFQPHRQALVVHNSYFVKTEGPAHRMVPRFERSLKGMLPGGVVFQVETLDDVIRRAMGVRPLLARVFGLFAGSALLLSMVGLYGVLAAWVRQRRREVGIRMALGASHFRIGRMVAQQGLFTILLGIGLGFAISFLLGHYLESLLFGVEATDPVSFLGSALLVLLAGALGTLSPLLRALRTDPLTCLGRSD